jgi:sarcosine oxidase subunit alpha
MTASQSPALLAGCLVDRSRPVSFTYEDRAMPAFEGQSIAAALYAAGIRVFTRSFKYHRPRGLFCVSGDCPNCLMNVDGRPNVRTCVEPVRDGQIVRHQNAWPSLDWDVLNVFDKLHRFLPVGFYYKRFHKPRWLWPIFEHVVRHVAGLGKVDAHAGHETDAEIEHLHTDVCVIGGGRAGMQAAAEASGSGARVVLLERMPRLGGRSLLNNAQVAADEESKLLSDSRVTVHCNTTAFGLYEGNLIGACSDNRFLKIRAKDIIVCTGSRQQPFLFENNDLPGIFLGDGVLRLASLYGVVAGRRVVVLTENDEGHGLAKQLCELGMDVAAVVDQRSDGMQSPKQNSIPLLGSSSIVRARGRKRLEGVWVATWDQKAGTDKSSQKYIACDVLCMASARQPANELLLQAGMRFRHVDGRWSAEQQLEHIRAAGSVAGTEQARCAGKTTPTAAGNAKRFVCLCEDVTEKDIQQALAEGFDHIETLKRYTTVNMGPCQGKMCGLAAVEVCARGKTCEAGAVGTTTSRPPAAPVELGVLAAGHTHQPIRRTPLHHWHEAAGAQWLDAGQWKRPESYGDPEAEVRWVRTNVGLIDVSTLGKIELIGPDAAELLDRIYLNRWSDLKPGRVRYGAMCNEDGILIDDGVGTRLDAERFYITATTGNADAIVQWLELWRATWRLNVTILSQTSAFAAMNLAGPRSREILQRLTSIALSPAAFPYMTMREGQVAGVACRVFRIGFVGELGYEIHCPSSHAWGLWETLHDAGADCGLRPFGVEAQRILRLEKGHLIIGQDTDALSHPLEAGWEWMVRFDKPVFVGRDPLLRLKAMGPRARLVGFFMLDTERVPPEGCQVVEQGRPVGRLTSTRYSPTLRKSLGLAWVPANKAAIGQRFFIRWDGADAPAIIVPTPFYDTEGRRLKS